jgi:hypothetical protein
MARQQEHKGGQSGALWWGSAPCDLSRPVRTKLPSCTDPAATRLGGFGANAEAAA